MQNFTLQTPTQIYFGCGRADEAGAAAREFGAKKLLVYYGGGSVVRTGLLERITSSLDAAGLEHVELGGVQPNPTAEFSAYTARFAKENGCDMILAVGGGSVIDSAKMAAYCVNADFEPWDVTMKRVVPTSRIPVGVVLTIAATGSEMSDSAVLTRDGLKRGFNSDLNRPVFAIMDPELTFTLPAYQTACGTVDIMMHTMERYMCRNEDNALADNLCEGLLRAVIDAGKRAYRKPDDYEARATLMFAGSLSHNGLMGVGRDCGLWAHKLEHEMSGLDERITHGAGLAVVWPAYLQFFANRGVGTKRLMRYATQVWGVESNYEHPERTISEGIEATRAYFDALDMPSTLGDVGLTEADIPVMSDKCTDYGKTVYPAIIPLGRAEVEEIFRLCL